MIYKSGQLPVPVDLLAGDVVGPGDGPGTAAEHADLAHLQQQCYYDSVNMTVLT